MYIQTTASRSRMMGAVSQLVCMIQAFGGRSRDDQATCGRKIQRGRKRIQSLRRIAWRWRGIVNALSETLLVEIKQNGKVYQQLYKRGHPSGPLKEVGVTAGRGTKTTFKPDPEIFQTVEYNVDILTNRLRELAFLNSGVKISLTDERLESQKVQEFHYTGGLVQFVQHINKSREKIHEQVIYFNLNKDVWAWKSPSVEQLYTETITSYVNTSIPLKVALTFRGFEQRSPGGKQIRQ